MTDNLDCIPYVEVQTDKGLLKFLIDTGANKNYISPRVVSGPGLLAQNTHLVRSVQGDACISRYVTFNPFRGSGFSMDARFFVFEFNDIFDGLIGYQYLQMIHAVIDAKMNILKLPDLHIPMLRKHAGLTIDLDSNETKHLVLPIDAPDGDFLLENDVKLNEFSYICSGLYSVKDKKACVCVVNKSSDPIRMRTSRITTDINNFETIPVPVLGNDNDRLLLDQMRISHLNGEEKKKLIDLVIDYRECFYLEGTSLTFTNAVKHKIETKDEMPVHVKSYRYPFCHKEEIQRQVRSMLAQGIIRPSVSPWSSPIWVVPKKMDASGKKKWRLVVDYRKVNEKTINDVYPIPNVTDILDKLGKCNYFSTLDLASGFHQIEVDPSDVKKTAFSVEHGHYEYLRMPFGLKNAPATFQRVMDNVLRDLVGKVCLVFFDDILIYSTSLEEHLLNLRKVFEALRKFNLKIQLDKSEFLRKEVAFLGHIVTPEGVKPNPDKIEVIKKWPLPSNEKELRGFLGTIGYYRRFIRDFAKIVKPLTVQLKKENNIEHTKDFVEAFQTCKEILTSSHVLQYPDFEKTFNLTTDASDYALGAVLSQGPIGKDRPIAFASRTLSRSEENYSTIEKELLAIVWACKYFRPYLFGRKFVLYTDHKPLTYIFSLKDPNGKLIRWRLTLEEYDYEVRYRPGKQNQVADGLSRLRLERDDDKSVVMQLNYNEGMSLEGDAESEVERAVSTVHSADTDDSHFIHMTEQPLNVFSNQIVLEMGNDESIEFEEVFPKVYRRTIRRGDFSVEILRNVFLEYMDPKRTNCVYCPTVLIPMIQSVYHDYFSRGRGFKVLISQKRCVICAHWRNRMRLLRKYMKGHIGVLLRIMLSYLRLPTSLRQRIR